MTHLNPHIPQGNSWAVSLGAHPSPAPPLSAVTELHTPPAPHPSAQQTKAALGKNINTLNDVSASSLWKFGRLSNLAEKIVSRPNTLSGQIASIFKSIGRKIAENPWKTLGMLAIAALVVLLCFATGGAAAGAVGIAFLGSTALAGNLTIAGLGVVLCLALAKRKESAKVRDAKRDAALEAATAKTPSFKAAADFDKLEGSIKGLRDRIGKAGRDEMNEIWQDLSNQVKTEHDFYWSETGQQKYPEDLQNALDGIIFYKEEDRTIDAKKERLNLILDDIIRHHIAETGKDIVLTNKVASNIGNQIGTLAQFSGTLDETPLLEAQGKSKDLEIQKGKLEKLLRPPPIVPRENRMKIYMDVHHLKDSIVQMREEQEDDKDLHDYLGLPVWEEKFAQLKGELTAIQLMNNETYPKEKNDRPGALKALGEIENLLQECRKATERYNRLK